MALVVKNCLSVQETYETRVLIPGSEGSPGGEHGNPLQYPCLESPMDRGAWLATVHRVPKRRTQLKKLSTLTHVYIALCQICFLII